MNSVIHKALHSHICMMHRQGQPHLRLLPAQLASSCFDSKY